MFRNDTIRSEPVFPGGAKIRDPRCGSAADSHAARSLFPLLAGVGQHDPMRCSETTLSDLSRYFQAARKSEIRGAAQQQILTRRDHYFHCLLASVSMIQCDVQKRHYQI